MIKILLKTLPNKRKALFFVTKQNRSHLKLMFNDYTGFNYYTGGKCKWLELGIITIKLKFKGSLI